MRSFLTAIIIFCTIGIAQAEVELDKGYIVEAQFVSTAPVQVIWGVLTDYNNIDKFVSVIKKSDYKDGILRQRVKGRWWFFSKTIDLELKVNEVLYNRIEFESTTSDGSFEIYRGAWEIKENGSVSIAYTLIAKPNFFIPRGIIRSVLRRQTNEYINEVEREIKRRVNKRRELKESKR